MAKVRKHPDLPGMRPHTQSVLTITSNVVYGKHTGGARTGGARASLLPLAPT